MGGGQTLNIAIPHLDKFAYIGVYSSGLFGAVRAARAERRPAACPGPRGKSSTRPSSTMPPLKRD